MKMSSMMCQDPVDTRKSGKGSLIKDINRHAEVVMGGTPASLPADAADAAATLAASAPVSSHILAAGRECPALRLIDACSVTSMMGTCIECAAHVPLQASLQGPSREMQDAAQRIAPGGSGLEDLRQQPVPDFPRLQVQVISWCSWTAWPLKPVVQLCLLVRNPCMHAQDPRTAFNAAAASSGAATDSNSADVWEAARAAHEALLGISCTQLDIGMPDDLALQVWLLLGESGAMHAPCQLV